MRINYINRIYYFYCILKLFNDLPSFPICNLSTWNMCEFFSYTVYRLFLNTILATLSFINGERSHTATNRKPPTGRGNEQVSDILE